MHAYSLLHVCLLWWRWCQNVVGLVCVKSHSEASNSAKAGWITTVQSSQPHLKSFMGTPLNRDPVLHLCSVVHRPSTCSVYKLKGSVPTENNFSLLDVMLDHAQCDLTLVSGNVWFVPEFGCVLDKLDIQPALRTSICNENKEKFRGMDIVCSAKIPVL